MQSQRPRISHHQPNQRLISGCTAKRIQRWISHIWPTLPTDPSFTKRKQISDVLRHTVPQHRPRGGRWRNSVAPTRWESIDACEEWQSWKRKLTINVYSCRMAEFSSAHGLIQTYYAAEKSHSTPTEHEHAEKVWDGCFYWRFVQASNSSYDCFA